MFLTKNINGNVLNVGNIFESAIHVNCHTLIFIKSVKNY